MTYRYNQISRETRPFIPKLRLKIPRKTQFYRQINTAEQRKKKNKSTIWQTIKSSQLLLRNYMQKNNIQTPTIKNPNSLNKKPIMNLNKLRIHKVTPNR